MIRTLRIRNFPEIRQSRIVLGIHFASSARLGIGRATLANGSKKCAITLQSAWNAVLRRAKSEHFVYRVGFSCRTTL